MKKLLLIILLAALMAGCSVEYWHTAIYIYENQCSEVITIKSNTSLLGHENGEITTSRDSVFSIQPKGIHKIEFYCDDTYCSGPLHWINTPVAYRDSTIVVKGDQNIVYRFASSTLWIKEPLYNIDDYELIQSEKHKKTWLFVFTDELFEEITNP